MGYQKKVELALTAVANSLLSSLPTVDAFGLKLKSVVAEKAKKEAE